MCNSIDEMRQSYSAEHYVTVGTTVTQLLPPSPNRIMVTVSAPTTGIISFGTNPSLPLGHGLTIATGSQPISLNIRDHGAIVSKPLYVIGSTSNIGVGIIYTMLDS